MQLFPDSGSNCSNPLAGAARHARIATERTRTSDRGRAPPASLSIIDSPVGAATDAGGKTDHGRRVYAGAARVSASV